MNIEAKLQDLEYRISCLESTLPRGKFVKPTPEEVTAYALSIGFILDGHIFIDFYESKGWLIGKTPMRCWRSAVRTWQRNNSAKPEAIVKKTKLYPIPGKNCKCGMPAVHKDGTGGYDRYTCSEHMPAKVKERFE